MAAPDFFDTENPEHCKRFLADLWEFLNQYAENNSDAWRTFQLFYNESELQDAFSRVLANLWSYVGEYHSLQDGVSKEWFDELFQDRAEELWKRRLFHRNGISVFFVVAERICDLCSIKW